MSQTIIFQGREYAAPFGSKKLIPMENRHFGRLTVVEALGSLRGDKIYWRCKCQCGNEVPAEGHCLRSGYTKSCGCWKREKISEANSLHGMSKLTEHAIWRKMHGRCYRKTSPDYLRYGGRGIYICERWLNGIAGLNGFQCFYEDMGPRPSLRHQVDRKDNSGPYSPENCEWATPKQQANNRRSNRIVSMHGREMTLTRAVEMFSVGPTYACVVQRLNKMNWSIEKSLLTSPDPIKGRRQKKAA